MIATRIAKKPDVRDNFTHLAQYIAAAKEEGEKLRDFWIVGCDAGEGIEDLDAALAEIEAVRAFKPKIDNKTYHLVVSVRPGEGERLSVDDLKDIERNFAKALGFADHQRVVGTHVNTDNFHMHVAYNMVDPRTLKMVTPWNDYAALERTARAMEKKYGLYVDLGMSDYQGQPKGSQKARAFEAHTWQQSFQNHVLDRREELLKVVGDAGSWQELHTGLAEHGIIARRRANGLVFGEADGKQTMKASLLDRSASLPALEQRLGPFEPAGEKAQKAAQQPKPHRRYKARPLARHPATSRLWRRYLGVRKRPTFLSRTIGGWKSYLLMEAYKDPMAMVLIIAHREMLEALFGGSGPRPTPPPRQPIPDPVRPALEHWRQAGTWARPATNAWLKDRKLPGHGCKVDEAGNLVVPFRDGDGRMVGLRLLAADGQSMDIGNVAGAAHVIDPGKRLGAGGAVVTTDYAMGAAIQMATEAPVIVVAGEDAVAPTVARLHQEHPGIEVVLATEGPPIDRNAIVANGRPRAVDQVMAERMGAMDDDALSADDALASLEDLDPVTLAPAVGRDGQAPTAASVAIPGNVTSAEIRAILAARLNDRAQLAWRDAGEWATPGNSAWLKAAGIRGYGVKVGANGELVVPLKDVGGRLRDVLAIDGAGHARQLIGDPDGPPLMHLVDPERRFGKGAIVIATDYASAAAIHRETRLPVAMAASPGRWEELAETLRERFPDERLVIALPAVADDGDDGAAQRLRAAIVRPKPEAIAAGEPDLPPGTTVSRAAAETMGAFKEDALSADEALASTAGLSPTTHAPVATFGDLAAAGRSRQIRATLARLVDDRAFLLWDKAKPPQDHDSHPWLGGDRARLDARLDGKGNLVAALRDAGGRLWGVEVVAPDGTTSARLGREDRPDLFHVVGNRRKVADGPILVAGDYTSAMALHQATGRPVVCVMGDDALKPVAEALRRKHPGMGIAIAAGDAAADDAAKAVGGVVLPQPVAGLTEAAIRQALRDAGIEAGKGQGRSPRTGKVRSGPTPGM